MMQILSLDNVEHVNNFTPQLNNLQHAVRCLLCAGVTYILSF